jgi:flagellar biosynthesis GTPase FlhF
MTSNIEILDIKLKRIYEKGYLTNSEYQDAKKILKDKSNKIDEDKKKKLEEENEKKKKLEEESNKKKKLEEENNKKKLDEENNKKKLEEENKKKQLEEFKKLEEKKKLEEENKNISKTIIKDGIEFVTCSICGDLIRKDKFVIHNKYVHK